MGNGLRKSLCHRAAVIIIIAISAVAVPVHAQVNAGIANCEELKDSVTQSQIASCTAHIGCNIVLMRMDCSNVKGFLKKLNETLSGRKSITNNDVFEAYSPMLTPSEALKTKVSIVQRIVRDAITNTTQEKLSYKSTTGAENYYEGGVKDGEKHGVGVTVNSAGYMFRGQHQNGKMNGQVQSVQPYGIIIIGDYIDSQPKGSIAYQVQGGTVYFGNYLGDDKWSGVIVVTGRNGDSLNKFFSSDGTFLENGPVTKAQQSAKVEPLSGPTATERGGTPASAVAAPGSPDYQPGGRPPASTATSGSAIAAPGSPDYQPRRPSTPAASGAR